ncbi:MAG: c-type cytochrome biogenesis protein CcsB [bacterium]
MYNEKLFGLAMIIYLGSSLLYIINLIDKNKLIARLATWTTLVGLLCHTLALIFRTLYSYKLGIGQPPFTNLYSSMVFFSWAIVLIYLIFEKKYGLKVIGVFVMPIAFLVLAAPSVMPNLIPNKIEPLVPALQSNWLLIHVVTCFFGYAAFAIAFGFSIMYLIKHGHEKNGLKTGFISLLPSSQMLDDLEYKAVAVGFPFLTLGIITGAAWAHYAWGSYWSWDPKETWSLITWFVYAAFLHARFTAGWRGKRTAILSILGFLFVLMTYFGVSFLLGGLHSYA